MTGQQAPVFSVPVDGRQLAILLSATFMLDHWSFERPEARTTSLSQDRNAIEASHRQVWRESRRILEAAGVLESPTSPWTREFIGGRAKVRGDLHLTPAQLHMASLALRVCHEEFSGNWADFCVASPGNIDWYDVNADDLLILAEKLDAVASEQDA